MASRKLQLFNKKRLGEKYLPEFLEKLSRNLNSDKNEIVIVDLEQSFNLFEEFRKGRQELSDSGGFAMKKFWTADKKQEAVSFIAGLHDSLFEDKTMIMFNRLSEYCGAVEIKLADLLQNIFHLMDLDNDDVIAYSLDDKGKMGLLFDYRTEWSTNGEEYIYELRLWGNDWITALNKQ